MNKILKAIGVLCIIICTSCNNEISLQRYFVDHQDDTDFLSVDLASSLLNVNKLALDDKEKEAIESIKKVNILALPMKENIANKYTEEKAVINKILNTDEYETLMRFGSNGTKVILKYQGDDSSIDEVIVFASNQERGLALMRVLGDDMKPENVAKLASAIEKGDVDMSALEGLISDMGVK